MSKCVENDKRVSMLSRVAVCLLSLGASVDAADFDNGKKLYGSLGCAGCHGDKNGSLLEGYPALVGMSSTFITSELNKYRNGVRKDPTMSAMAAGLSDKNINDLAAYIASR